MLNNRTTSEICYIRDLLSRATDKEGEPVRAGAVQVINQLLGEVKSLTCTLERQQSVIDYLCKVTVLQTQLMGAKPNLLDLMRGA